MGDCLLLSVDMQRPTILLLLLAASVFGRKFCPGERNGNRCAAGDKAFKCGVFFYNLQGDGNLQFLAELPKALKKTKKEYWPEILGDNITPATFEDNINCDATTGAKAYNSRCYGMFQNIVDKPLDSCDRNVLVGKAGQTVGDYLCGQVRRWLKRDSDFQANGRRDIEIRFGYSFCKNDWRLWLPAPPPSPPRSLCAAHRRASSRDRRYILQHQLLMIYSSKYRI